MRSKNLSKRIHSNKWVISIFFLIFIAPFCLFGQNIVINEIMSKNNTILQDIDGDYSDWIELRNLDNTELDLTNYTISDDQNDIFKWTLPNIIIPANGYLILFASNKNRYEDNELHTNFKLDQSGESVLLSNASGDIISQIEPIYIPADNSYAVFESINNELAITASPTPSQYNLISGGIYCSHESGFYDEAIDLELTLFNANEEIRYTLNGEVPSINSSLYAAPIEIKNNSEETYHISAIPTTPLIGPEPLDEFVWKTPVSVYKCNVIRYAAFENGTINSSIYTKSFFIDPEISDRYEFPIISLVTDNLNLFDYETGIYVPGIRFAQNGFNWFPEGNYSNSGSLWERDVHISYFTNSGTRVFETDAGMRMKGNGSTSYPQKSFNLYFRSEYGMNKIKYPIFNNPLVDTYKRITFRNAGNDFTKSHLKDPILHEVMSSMDLEVQDYQPTIVFINGEYWGIHNLRESYNKYYFKYKHGIDSDSINILGICGEEKEGSNQSYTELIDFINLNDLSEDENYEYVSSKLDISNFIDFQIAEIYFANYDWPCNNFKIWKDNDPESKWRFLIYDLDFSFGYNDLSTYGTQSMERATNLGEEWPYCTCSNLLFRNLLKNNDFKQQFLNTFAIHLSTTFTTDRIKQIVESMGSQYKNEIAEHILRWNYPQSVGDWNQELDTIIAFAKNRPCYMASNLRSYFGHENFSFDCNIDVDANDHNLLLFPNPSDGQITIYNNSGHNIENANITIFNYLGQEILKQNNISFYQNERVYLNFSSLDKGSYVLTFENGKELYSFKIIIVSRRY